MIKLSTKSMIAALLAGSLAATAGGTAFARAGGGPAGDPASQQQGFDKRIDRALGKTDASAEQKQKIADIFKAAFKDERTFRDKRTENRKAMEAALQAPTIDATRIEAIRVEQVKIVDDSSKRLTQALEDAANVLSPAQRQAFFKAWSDRPAKRPG
ncbi:MAG: periplasmic heavy metal sensor [Reyranellaceae bacterium]